VGAGSVARQKLTFRMMGSAFHDGTRTNAADLLYAYMFAYRWGARGERDSFDPQIAAASAIMRERLLAFGWWGPMPARGRSDSATSRWSAS
jgi:hypothetical protein